MSIGKSLLGLAALAGVATPSAAQFAVPAPEADQIVVIGTPFNPEIVSDFVAEVGVPTGEDQYGRWYDRVCPAVVGLRADIGLYVLETIKPVAEVVGAPLSSSNSCRANVVIIFTYESATAVAQLREGRPDLFGEISPAELERIVQADAPASVVSRLNLRGSGGQRSTQAISSDAPEAGRNESANYFSPGRVDIPKAENHVPGEAHSGGGIHAQAEGSRISRAVRPEFDFRLVVIDLHDVEGQTIRQLSAYAAMVALGDFNIIQPIQSQRTILNAFHDPVHAPADITDWDLAYLAALYGVRPGRNSATQRRQLATASHRSLENGRFNIVEAAEPDQ